MNRLFFLELLESKPRLLARMVAFNSPEVPRPPEGSATERAWAHEDLRRLLEKQAASDAAASGFWDFAEESRRLAFFTPQALAQFSGLAAAALMGEQIARTIDRAGVAALKTSMGEDLYRYGLMRGRFQAAGLPAALERFLPDAAPEARFPVYASLVVAIVRSAWPRALAERTAGLVKEAGLTEMLFPEAPEPALCSRVWHFSKKIIVREQGGTWSEFFD